MAREVGGEGVVVLEMEVGGADDGGVRSGRRESSEEMLRSKGWLSCEDESEVTGIEASVKYEGGSCSR